MPEGDGVDNFPKEPCEVQILTRISTHNQDVCLSIASFAMFAKTTELINAPTVMVKGRTGFQPMRSFTTKTLKHI